jgi:Ca2+-binding RTX toxin-like protein
MLNLNFRAIVGASWGNLGIDIRDLELVDGPGGRFILAASGPSGGMVSFRLGTGDAQVIDQVHYNANIAQAVSGTATLISNRDAQSVILGRSAQDGALGYSISSKGQIGHGVAMGLPVHDGTKGSAITSTASGHVFAMTNTGRLQYFAPDGTGGYKAGQVVLDSAATHLLDPVALSTVMVGGQELLLSLCGRDGGLSAYHIPGAGGTLNQGGSVGTGTGLGLLTNPTDLATVESGGRSFAIIASAADQGTGGALSVVELHPDGSLNVTDHLLDTLTTRFGRVDSIATAQSGDWTYVVAGGGDAGISLFVLTPTGRLLHMDSFEDTTASGLERISALTMYDAGGRLDILAASQSSQGISQVEVSLAGQGAVIEAASGALNGTSDNDMLVGGAGAGTLSGGAGDDILIDGAALDRLTGGDGADLFVLEADGARDLITDFNPAQDRLELGAVPMLYDTSRLQVTETSWGAVLLFPGGEETEIRRAGGGGLTQAEIFAAIIWGPDRPPLVLYNEVMGTAATDRLEGTGGTDLIYGTGGADTLSGFSGADLLDGGNGNDWLRGGNGTDTLLGGANADTLLGGGHDDRLEGQHGFDLLEGGFGHDWMHGGAQNDTLLGGGGDDSLFGAFHSDRVEGQDGADRLEGGNGGDWLHGGAQNDTVLGGANADHLIGAFGDDRLEGQHGFDTLEGGFGDDWMHGGSGHDHLLGGGMNDTLFGAFGDDSLEGQYGADLIYGGFGHDWIHGGAMSDTIHADRGDDVVNGGAGPDLVHLGDGDDLFRGFNQGGWLGRDTILGGTGDDTIRAAAGNDELHGEAGDDFLFGGSDWDLLTGGNGNDTLQGAVDNDTLHGGTGNDRLEAGLGNDLLTGGAGADTFVFFTGSGRNVVTDFDPGTDRMELDVNAARVADLTVTNAPRGVWLEWPGGELLLEGLRAADIGNSDMDFL